MNKEKIEKIFSEERLHKYFEFFPNDEVKAIELYKANIRLSETFYPLISIFEVALRNSINKVLSNRFQTDNWYSNINISEIKNEIDGAIDKILNRKEILTPHKITAELTFGFWSRLFNSKYELQLWKDLRKAFPNIPKCDRQRHILSAPINRIRILRNRIFHHEPIIWYIENIELIIGDIYKVLGWLNKDLPILAKEFDGTFIEFQRIRELLNNRK